MTINQSLIIHKLPTLFSILNEIKSNLNFKIEYLNDEEITNISKKNVVVISGDKKSNLQNQVKIEEYPINIQKLIENINIQFLKNKFNQQNNVKAGKYHINLNSRVMILESKSLQLTEKEVKIISFLNDSGSPISINKLQSEVWGYKSKLETHTVETHVYRLRKKIEKKFKDNSFIVSLKNGYKIKD
tara:strand:- start:1027 stop:1587 length:561 start_codon:yes stop_codon:yes gene_type:complete